MAIVRILVAGLLATLLCACQNSRESGSTDAQENLELATAALNRGEFDRLGSLASQGLKEAERINDPVLAWRFKLLLFEFHINNRRNDEARSTLQGTPPESLRPRVLVDQARAFLQLGRLDEADTALRSAETSVQYGDPRLAAECLKARADWLRRKGEAQAADAKYEEAYQMASAAGLLRLQASIAGSRGLLQEKLGALDQAIHSNELSVQAADKAGDKVSQVRARNNLGWCYNRIGAFERALDVYREASTLASGAHIANLTASNQNGIGCVFFALRDFNKAINYYSQALATAPDAESQARFINNLASVYIERQEWDKAREFNDRAIELAQGDQERLGNLLLNAAEIDIGEGKLDTASKTLQKLIARRDSLKDDARWETFAAESALSAARDDVGAAARNYQLALDEIERIGENLRENQQISFRSKWNHYTQSYVDLLVSRDRTEQALGRAEASRALVLRQSLGIRSGSVDREGVPFKKVAEKTGSVLLSYWLAPKRSFLWVVTPTDLKMFELPASAKIESWVESYQNYLQQGGDPIADRSSVAATLYEQLVGPASGMIPPGSKVILVPDGRLHDLNFETLLTSRQQPHYWIQDVTVAVAKSLSTLRPEGASQATKSILLIGAPVNEDLPPLPAAESEIETIRKRFPPGERTVLVGPDAVPQAYAAAQPGGYRLIHFAAHAVANPSLPLDSAVILSAQGGTYRLFARDVRNIPLQASLVTLSACRSAGARAYSGEGLVGFAWAFMLAGARNVVAGLWDVDDRAGAQLMDDFYAAIVTGESPASALREAKLKMIGSGFATRKPLYWAPFQVYTRSNPFDPIRAGKSAKAQTARREATNTGRP